MFKLRNSRIRRALLERSRTGRYRARSVKRQWISKPGGGKLRPLGIPVMEDKIVQHAVKRILEAIWEPDFHDESMIALKRETSMMESEIKPRTRVASDARSPRSPVR